MCVEVKGTNQTFDCLEDALDHFNNELDESDIEYFGNENESLDFDYNDMKLMIA